VAALACWLLPKDIKSARFLTGFEWICAGFLVNGAIRGRARPRFKYGDSSHSCKQELTPVGDSPYLEKHKQFCWSDMRQGFFNCQAWLAGFVHFCILSGLASFNHFVGSTLCFPILRCKQRLINTAQLPTMIKDSGIARDAKEAQLWSMIPYVAAVPVIGEFLHHCQHTHLSPLHC